MIHVGLDIGGTKLLVAAFEQEGSALPEMHRASTPADLEEGLALIDSLIGEVAAGRPIAAIGAAVGGPLDWRRGIVSPLHQPRWRDLPLKARMQSHWACPFYVDVDTNVAALGEYLAADPAPSSLLYVTVSTGMGGGLVTNGQLFRGHRDAHPEIAHQSVPYRCAHPERIRCDCGGGACLEALVSGNGIRRVYGKPAEELNDAEWEEVGHNLGHGLANAAALYCPEEIVLGGGVALGGGERLLEHVRAVFTERLRIVPVPRVRLSRHGYHTALMGALALARRGAELGFESVV